MEPVREVPPAKEEKPVAESVQTLKFALGPKRYQINIKVSAEELKPTPARVIPIK